MFSPRRHIELPELAFCMGIRDESLFYHHHPMDAHDYESFSVRSVYEAAVLLDKHLVQIDDYKVPVQAGQPLLNVGELAQTLSTLTLIKHWLINPGWQAAIRAQMQAGSIDLANNKYVRDGLLWLCQTDVRRTRALKLWQDVVPADLPPPSFMTQSNLLGAAILGDMRLDSKTPDNALPLRCVYNKPKDKKSFGQKPSGPKR